MKANKCKICKSKTKFLFKKQLLNKHTVSYFQCNKCGFLQTEDPFWLNESYSEAIAATDVGLIGRNLHYANLIEKIINHHFDNGKLYLDYGGGYGLFTRLMRDKGIDFYHFDRYCNNIFAKYLSLNDLPKNKRKFELVTAFEVMEHITNPQHLLKHIFTLTNNFIFSTTLIPDHNIDSWWYLATETGQHVSFYTEESMQLLANNFNKIYYKQNDLHIFTTKRKTIFNLDTKKISFLQKLLYKKNKLPLEPKTQRDYEITKKQLAKK